MSPDVYSCDDCNRSTAGSCWRHPRSFSIPSPRTPLDGSMILAEQDPRPCTMCGKPHVGRRFGGPNGVDDWRDPDDRHLYWPQSWEDFARSLMARLQSADPSLGEPRTDPTERME